MIRRIWGPAVSQLCRIIYCSRSLLKGSRSDIETHIRRILATARTNNPQAGLTGAMAFTERCFAQVLEGEHENLSCLFQKIRSDSRHTDVKILARSNTRERLFASWSMAYVDTPYGHGHPLAHFSFEAALIDGAAPQALELLKVLRRAAVAGPKSAD